MSTPESPSAPGPETSAVPSSTELPFRERSGFSTPPSREPTATERLIEEFAREYVKDRRLARRWRMMFRAGLVIGLLGIAWALFIQNMHDRAPSGPHTALVELRGEITAESPSSAEIMLSGLKDAFDDKGAKAVVIRINSPGGSPVQAGIINDEIRRLKAKHDKKVYAVVEESCASGAYYVAVAADQIFVDKASVVGSIGVLMDSFGFSNLMSKVGIERRLLTAGANKGMLDPFSPTNETQRAYAQAVVNQIHRQFIDTVRAGRGSRLKETPETFSGLFWNGEEAVKIGLADGLGNLDYVAREVVKAEDIIDYTPKENVAERLAKRFGASMGAAIAHTLLSLPKLH